FFVAANATRADIFDQPNNNVAIPAACQPRLSAAPSVLECRLFPARVPPLSDSGQIVADTATRIFTDLADPQTVNRAKDKGWKEELWGALDESGLTLAWVPEKLGGADGGLADGFEVLRVAGRFAVAVPLAETLLAGWLLARSGIASSAGALT